MPRYAQIDVNGVAMGFSDLSGEVDAPHMVLIGAEEDFTGWTFAEGEWVEPPPEAEPSVPPVVTETQFIRAAVRSGLINAAEGKAYLARGELPGFVSAAIAGLPEGERDDAEMKATGAATFERHDPLFGVLVSAGAATEGQLDDLFRLAATL